MTYEKLEEIREKYKAEELKIKKRVNIASMIVGIIICAGFIYLFYLDRDVYELPLYLLFFFISEVMCLIFTYVIVSVFSHRTNIQMQYETAYKQFIVKRTLESFFTDLLYIPEKGIDKEVLKNSYIYTGDIYSSNDYVKGKYKNVLFEQSDVKIVEKREEKDSKGNTHTYYDTIFQGKWMIFDFNKNFKYNLAVVQDSIVYPKEVKKIKLENDDFNKKFAVYAGNEEEAFYILTPHMMERLLKLDEDNKGRVSLLFKDNKLYIGLNNYTDSFEPPTYMKKIDEKVEIEKALKDIKSITQFVDELDLDNNLFK